MPQEQPTNIPEDLDHTIHSSNQHILMGKIPVKIKAVTYALSPFQQKIMPGIWNELAHKATHKVTENWINAILLVGPVVGVHWYVKSYLEREKLAHRY